MKVEEYIQEITGANANLTQLTKDELGIMPYYLTSTFRFYHLDILGKNFIMVDIQHYPFNVGQIQQQLQIVSSNFGKKVVLQLNQIDSLLRKRLIEARINFIAPGKQLFLPDLLINLSESKHNFTTKVKSKKLLPSAQFILLYHILFKRKNDFKIEEKSFKELAKYFNYTQMAITKAVDNLQRLELCTVKGTKEKYIQFCTNDRHQLWGTAKDYLVNPVLKRVFVDTLPKKLHYKSNASALCEYTDMNPLKQQYYAIDKTYYFELQKAGKLLNENEYEGKYCLEVYKYNPEKLTHDAPVKREEEEIIDPLSLYLSLKGTHDERVEMAMEQLTDTVQW